MTSPTKTPSPDYETADAQVKSVLIGGAVLAAGIAVCLAVTALFPRVDKPLLPTMSFRHGVENDSGIERDWRAQDALVEDHLGQYAWVDREKKIVRLPIERTMELMAAEAQESP